jgi:Capsular polysaccharide synthesis protein
MSSVKRVIWQYWETRGDKPRFIDGLHDIARANAGVEVVLVTPETLAEHLPDIEADVLRIDEPAHKADMIRSRLVLRHGGMWLDSDAIVLGDLNGLFDKLEDHEFIGFNDAGRLQPERPWVRVNCFLSRPGGSIVTEWVRSQRQALPRTTFEWSEIGARMLNAACLRHAPSAAILPFEDICPIPWDRVEDFTVQDDARAAAILNRCKIVMLSNHTLQARQAPLLALTVDEIMAGDYLLAKVLQRAVAAARDARSDRGEGGE